MGCARAASQPAKVASGPVRLAASSMLAVPRLSENQTVTAGPWAIGPTYKANKLQSCTMSRSGGELGATFVRAQDGLSVILKSQQWKLHRGKAYPVRLTAGSRSVDANARAETKSVILPLADSTLNSRLRSANNLHVHAEGATLRVPLDSSSTAFERLEECFNSGEAPETNPFLKRNTSESNPFVALAGSVRQCPLYPQKRTCAVKEECSLSANSGHRGLISLLEK